MSETNNLKKKTLFCLYIVIIVQNIIIIAIDFFLAGHFLLSFATVITIYFIVSLIYPFPVLLAFCERKFLFWSAPLTYFATSLIYVLFYYLNEGTIDPGGDQLPVFIFYFKLCIILYCFVVSIIFFIVKNMIDRKNQQKIT